MASLPVTENIDFKIKALEEGIARAAQNIQIFSNEVQKQILLKVELEAQLQVLKQGNNGNNNVH